MVLRGAQFRRSGPAGCIFLTRRALSSCTVTFLQGRFDAVWLLHGSGITYGRLMRFHGGDQCWHPHEGPRHMARECDLCHGDIGEL